MTTWIVNDKNKRLEKGYIISLKDTPGLWEIVELYKPDIYKCDVKRNWHVGGM